MFMSDIESDNPFKIVISNYIHTTITKTGAF
jgi:hypothetical protein